MAIPRRTVFACIGAPSPLVLWTAATALLMAVAGLAWAEDWPRFRGPNFDGISKETGGLAPWPADGPKKLWQASVGVGYSSFSVSQGHVFTMGNIANKDVVSCFDTETGQQTWKYEYACSPNDPNGYKGPRCTPTVDGDRVYTMSRAGQLFCLSFAKGEVLWSKDLGKDFGAKPPQWGFAGSPLVEKEWLLCEVGAPDAAVVALDKKTGNVVWKNGKDGAGYSSIVPFDANGERLFAIFASDFFVVRRMKDGSEVGRVPWKTSYGVNAATPIIAGNQIFISSGYGTGCTLLQLSNDGLTEVWRNKNMRNHASSCVLWQGCLYGFDESELKCLDFKTGAVKWSEKRYGKGSLALADGKLLVYSQNGKLALVAPSPDGFKEISSAQILKGNDTWSVPVLANGHIYCRNLDTMVCLDATGK